MIRPGTIRECFACNDWGRNKRLALALVRSDADLDRSFATGAGSLRATLRHRNAAVAAVDYVRMLRVAEAET